MAAEPTTAKLCTVCGIDCSGIPRIKDQQGRYICKECFDKAKQTRQTQKNPAPAAAPVKAAAAPDLNDNTFLLNLGSKESTGIQGTKPCPECGRAMPANAVICIGCGFNTSTGKRVPVRVIKAKKEKGSSSGGAAAAAQAGSSMIFCVIGGLVGGGIGAGIWAAVALFTGLEVGYVAWAVGGLTGLGCSIGARGHVGAASGGMAAAVSVAAILAGKFFAGSAIYKGPVDQWFGSMFGPLDALFFVLALATAFKVGSVEIGHHGE